MVSPALQIKVIRMKWISNILCHVVHAIKHANKVDDDDDDDDDDDSDNDDNDDDENY